jgi:DNA-binding transcriptional regulator YhcF (GntR family)
MTATKAVNANLTLTTNLSNAVLEAIKAGLTKEEVIEMLNRLITVLEAADNE